MSEKHYKDVLLVRLMIFPSYGKHCCLEVIYRKRQHGKQRMKTSLYIPSGRLCVVFPPLRIYRPLWDSLAVQCLGLGTCTAKGAGLVLGRGTKILQAARGRQKAKQNEKLTDHCDTEAPSNP